MGVGKVRLVGNARSLMLPKYAQDVTVSDIEELHCIRVSLHRVSVLESSKGMAEGM